MDYFYFHTLKITFPRFLKQCVCVCVCVRACVRACVRECVCVCFPKVVFGAKVVCMCPIEISV